MHNNVPKVGYKLMNRRRRNGGMATPYQCQRLTAGSFQIPNSEKVVRKCKYIMDRDALNKGRFSVLLDKREAKKQIDETNNELWLVEIKSTTAFIGSWYKNKVAVVDSIKLVKLVAKWSLLSRLRKRFDDWF